ncbi:MAG: hypothetical protein ABW215_06510 [Kibdelosporangium sp.]
MTAQPDTAPAQEPELPPLPPSRARLNQPYRAFIAVAEVLVAVGLVFLAFWLWSRTDATITQILDDSRPPYVSRRYYGNFMSLAILSGTVAGLLVLDALRQLVLALRARPQAKGRRRK